MILIYQVYKQAQKVSITQPQFDAKYVRRFKNFHLKINFSFSLIYEELFLKGSSQRLFANKYSKTRK